MNAKKSKTEKKPVMLALQGGGSHAAYVWGVIDQLLTRDDLEIVGISGASGGAMIGAVLAYGLSQERTEQGEILDEAGRRDRTRKLLDKFWIDVAAIGDDFLNPYRFTTNPWHSSWNIDGTLVPLMLNAMSLVTSPYQAFLGPRQNPVARAITNTMDLRALRQSENGPALYVSATNVRTNQTKVFNKKEIYVEHLLASACLPMLDRAIEIDGEFYWDGGYTSNPALAPLIEQHSNVTGDLVIVGVNPIMLNPKSVPPRTAWQIIDRMNEITFNAALIGELKRIASINELLAQVPDTAPAKQPNGNLYDKNTISVHYMEPHAQMAELGVASKSNTAYSFLSYLKSLGQEQAMQWQFGPSDRALEVKHVSDETLKNTLIKPYHWNARTIDKNLLHGPSVTRQ